MSRNGSRPRPTLVTLGAIIAIGCSILVGCTRIRELPPEDTLERAVIRTFGLSRYGGMWVDPIPGGSTALRVALVRPSGADAAMFKQLTQNNPRVILESVTYSYRQLEGFKEVVLAILQERGVEQFGVDADTELNRVHVDVDVEDATLAKGIVDAGVPADAFVIEPGWSMEPAHWSQARRSRTE